VLGRWFCQDTPSRVSESLEARHPANNVPHVGHPARRPERALDGCRARTWPERSPATPLTLLMQGGRNVLAGAQRVLPEVGTGAVRVPSVLASQRDPVAPAGLRAGDRIVRPRSLGIRGPQRWLSVRARSARSSIARSCRRTTAPSTPPTSAGYLCTDYNPHSPGGAVCECTCLERGGCQGY
jgi:hypothetical protein